MAHKGIIAQVVPDSIASELELEPGDRLVSVNGQSMNDIIDLSFALADDMVELLIEKKNGEQELIEIEKEYDEDLGIEFESAVFDGVRRCANRCIFCFVDQMAPNMRQSLYVKDDDYRLSFLYGNFVTLTNLTERDMQRIQRLHLTPLYVSVHTTTPAVREKMLNNRNAGKIMQQINALIEAGVDLHAQVVLCPGINDGEVLEKTIADLYALHPHVMSLAIVPVGLSRFRDNCYPLQPFSPEAATVVIQQVNHWQQRCRAENDLSFVYLADEFYLAANQPIPDYEVYDDFPQIENGVGLVRDFLAEWAAEPCSGAVYQETHYLDLVCGISAEKILRPLLEEVNIPNLTIRLVPVVNQFFGENITVSGLLTGQDILKSLQALPGPRTGVIVPGLALRKGEPVFLDDMDCLALEAELGVPVRPAFGAEDLRYLLLHWR